MRKISLFLLILCLFIFCSCGKEEYILNEKTFFLILTNMQYYPEQYVGVHTELDCFTYIVEDTEGHKYMCGVRQCSSEYGCKCGKDRVIGFILDYDKEIPEPVNQSGADNYKTWIHLTGSIKSKDKTRINIYAYNQDGSVDYNTVETIEFLTFSVSNIELIEDYSNLNYYVSK